MTEPDQHGLFDHPAFDYKGGVRLNEPSIAPSWLPYYERMALVAWLYGVGMIAQAIMMMPFGNFTRLLVASLGVWWALLGMGVALRRANYHLAVTYAERTRRRRWTVLSTTLGMLVWVGVVYLVL